MSKQVEQFTKSEFQAVVVSALKTINAQGKLSSCLIDNEHQFTFQITDTNKKITIRSSVQANGLSAGSGEDSIRIWVSYWYPRANKWIAMKKLDKWTTRIVGWESRVTEKLQSLYNLALADSGVIRSVNNKQSQNEKKDDGALLAEVRDGQPPVPSFLSDKDAVPSTKKSTPAFEPSEYQKAVFEFVKTGQGHGVVLAVAGSGKTTTIVQALEFTDVDQDVAFVAFNKRIATELGKRAPDHVHTSTLHSLGFANIRNMFGKVKVEPNKLWKILREVQDRLSWDDADNSKLIAPAILKLVSLCKATLKEPTSENLAYICDRWSVELNGLTKLAFHLAKTIYDKSLKMDNVIDYDDMIFWCANGKVPCKRFDFLFVDETQDLNAAQLEMVIRSIKDDGRIVAVGDKAQSIYGFRGADTEAVSNIISRLEATVLPLSITYRCPKSHVALAQELVPEIQAADFAKDGIVETISPYKFSNITRSGDLVLCRCNAPLVAPAFALIRKGIKAVILGRDIGKGLKQFVKKVQKKHKVNNIQDTLHAMEEYTSIEISKLIAAKKTMRAQTLEDKFETIVALAEGCNTVYDLEQKIDQVFSDEEKGVVFSSIHKAKGGEAERVFILKPELMPHPKASEGWEMEQEYNIKYVSLTRSKSELYFVS